MQMIIFIPIPMRLPMKRASIEYLFRADKNRTQFARAREQCARSRYERIHDERVKREAWPRDFRNDHAAAFRRERRVIAVRIGYLELRGRNYVCRKEATLLTKHCVDQRRLIRGSR